MAVKLGFGSRSDLQCLRFPSDPSVKIQIVLVAAGLLKYLPQPVYILFEKFS